MIDTESLQPPISQESGASPLVHDTPNLSFDSAAPDAPGTVPVQSPPKVEQTQEMRFKTLRTLKEKAEQERDQALRILQERDAVSKNTQAIAQPQDADDFGIGNDELAEGKHLKKMYGEIRRLRSEVSQYQQNSSTMTAEARLRISYPDIEKVVSKENMEILAVQYPELWTTIQANNDFYTKGAAAYTMMKKLGIHVEDTYEPDRERVNVNVSKPKPSIAVAPQQSNSPLTQANAFANGLTESLKAQLYKEMMESRRNY